MSQPQTIEITHGGCPALTLIIVEQYRIGFYATTFSDKADGSGWAQSPNGRYWRLDVPPSVYHALSVGDACGVLWRGEECLGALDWDAREQEPNATAYQVDPRSASGQIAAYAGDDIRAADGKPALLGRIEADPDDEWWLIVPD
jgi:hypothetical protein